MNKKRLWARQADGSCECGLVGCKQPGKHPGPGSGVAQVLDGADYFVLDIDTKFGNGFTELQAKGCLIKPTYSVQTPSGGGHYYYKHLPGMRMKRTILKWEGLNVDIKCTGYVVIPPSFGYTINNDGPIEEPPAWLLRIIEEQITGHVDVLQVSPEMSQVARSTNRIGFTTFCQEEASPGQKGNGRSKKALVVAGVGARLFRLPKEDVIEVMNSTYAPRCTPPLEGKYVEHKVDEAIAKGEVLIGPDAVEEQQVNEWWQAVQDKQAKDPKTKKAQKDWIEKQLVEKKQEEFTEQLGGWVNEVHRRMPNPKHKYSYSFGSRISSMGDDKLHKVDNNYVCMTLLRSQEWAGVFQLDVLKDRIYAVDPPIKLKAEEGNFDKEDCVAIENWFNAYGWKINPAGLYDIVRTIANECKYNPIQDYLTSLPDGDPSVLTDLATELFGADKPIENQLLEKFLISAVARAMIPGCQADSVLVLYGPGQGEGKTQFVRIMFTPFNLHQLPAFHNVEASRAIMGKWGVEIPELHSMMKSDIESVKDYLTRTVDQYRRLYSNNTIENPRSCVFIGTTNEEQFLTDPTGNRRFWPIQVRKFVDTDKLKQARDAIWAGAMAAYKAGTRWYFTGQELAEMNFVEHQEQHMKVDLWEENILEYCHGKERVRSREVMRHLNPGLSDGEITPHMCARAAKVFIRNGFKLKRIQENGIRIEYYIVPEKVRDAKRLHLISGGKS